MTKVSGSEFGYLLKPNATAIGFKSKIDDVLSDKRITKQEFDSIAKDLEGGEKVLLKIMKEVNPQVDFKDLLKKTGYIQLSSETQKKNLTNILDAVSGNNIKIEHVSFDVVSKNRQGNFPNPKAVDQSPVPVVHEPTGKLVVPNDNPAVEVKNPGVRAFVNKAITLKNSKNEDVTFAKGERCVARELDDNFMEVQKVAKGKKGDWVPTGEWMKVAKDQVKNDDQSFKKTTDPLFSSIPSTKDVKQGAIGNCFLIAGINALIQKGGPEEIYKMMKDNGDTVTVRVFELKEKDDLVNIGKKIKTYEPKFITFDKSTLDTSLTLKHPTRLGSAFVGEHAKDSLWVQMLEKAYAIHAGSYQKLDGGGGMDDPLAFFTGKPSVCESINMPKNGAKLAHSFFNNFVPQFNINDESLGKLKTTLKEKHGLTEDNAEKIVQMVKDNKDKFNDVTNVPQLSKEIQAKTKELGQELTDLKIFNELSNHFETPDFKVIEKFQKTQMGKDFLKEVGCILSGEKTVNGKVKKDYSRQITFEEMETILKSPGLKDLSEETKTKMLDKAKEMFPEAAKTKKANPLTLISPKPQDKDIYSEPQKALFTKIKTLIDGNQYVGAGTRKNVGKSDGTGFSGGESVSKGLVGGHAYTVSGVVEMNGNKFVKVENPWGSTGRAYDLKDGKLEPKKVDDGVYWLELNDFAANFDELYYSKP